MSITLEICATSIASCINAQEGGADRIELCDNLADGGTTPGYGMIKIARQKLRIPLYPIIRPRGGDFLYTDDEFTIMQNDIRICKQLGCDGIVTGILTADGKVDKRRTRSLVELAWPMGVTFHRAFDVTDDPLQALEDVIETGCERILTSGQQNTAPEGTALIASLVQQAGGRIIIMAGSGVRAHNIAALIRDTQATEYHTTAQSPAKSNMQFQRPDINMGKVFVTTADTVAAIRKMGEQA